MRTVVIAIVLSILRLAEGQPTAGFSVAGPDLSAFPQDRDDLERFQGREMQDLKKPESSDGSQELDSAKPDIDVAAINDFYKQIVPFDTSMFQGTWQVSNEEAENPLDMLMQTFDSYTIIKSDKAEPNSEIAANATQQLNETADEITQEVIRAINSGKARVFLFRSTSDQFMQVGTLLPYFNQYTEDEDDGMGSPISQQSKNELFVLTGRILIFQGSYRERELDINFSIAPNAANGQKVSVTAKSSISESIERR